MKFKTVSEFIHALEVEGKKFKRNYNSHIGWSVADYAPMLFFKDGTSTRVGPWDVFSTEIDFQEYLPKPETEEIELEEWLVGSPFGGHLHPEFHFKGKSPQGSLPSYKTGQTRKVKVPK